jgi:lipopolysaccharide/colanic/teichoic acid biosynthesis glycosyltransferase
VGYDVTVPVEVEQAVPAGVDDIRLRPGIYRSFGKAALDRTVSVLLLAVLAPLIGIVALAVRCTLGKGVFYRQVRVGQDGRHFTVVKFRTMQADRRQRSTNHDGPDRRVTHKTTEDPRHTPLGRVLRRFSLDELPQLWNVVRGDMSLVGPRPELPIVVDRYEEWQHLRHLVKPGITGLWQVSERGEAEMHECVETDLDYVRRLSFVTDMGIICRTIPAAVRGTGS